jgi:hypothetical protein
MKLRTILCALASLCSGCLLLQVGGCGLLGPILEGIDEHKLLDLLLHGPY